jgi:hypothetical protein
LSILTDKTANTLTGSLFASLQGGKDDKKGKKEPEEPPPEPTPALFFTKHVKDAVQSYCATWQDKDETSNFSQRHDVEMVKATLRPLVFEEVRQEVGLEA